MHAHRFTVIPTVLAAAVACSGTDVTRPDLTASNSMIAENRYHAVTSITISPATATVGIDSTVKLGTIVRFVSGSLRTGIRATWTSSDTTIAKVSSSGIVTGQRNGVVTITARVWSVSATAQVTVGKGGTQRTTQPTTPTSSPPPTTTSTGSSSTTSSTQAGSSLSGPALVSDDYTHYSSTQDLLANISTNIGGTGSSAAAMYTDGAHSELVTLDKTVTYNGHATAKYSQPGGVSNTPELWVHLPQSLTKMWFRVKVRFSPGFTTTGSLTNSANAYKLLGWGWTNGVDGRGSIEITNTNQYQLYWYVLQNGSTVSGGNFADAGRVSTEWTDGQWYDYIMEYEQTSSTSAVTRAWIQKDGDPLTLRAVSSGTGSAGNIPRVGSVMVGVNFNQVRLATQSQAVWFGQWEVVDGAKYANPFSVPGV